MAENWIAWRIGKQIHGFIKGKWRMQITHCPTSVSRFKEAISIKDYHITWVKVKYKIRIKILSQSTHTIADRQPWIETKAQNHLKQWTHTAYSPPQAVKIGAPDQSWRLASKSLIFACYSGQTKRSWRFHLRTIDWKRHYYKHTQRSLGVSSHIETGGGGLKKSIEKDILRETKAYEWDKLVEYWDGNNAIRPWKITFQT